MITRSKRKAPTDSIDLQTGSITSITSEEKLSEINYSDARDKCHATIDQHNNQSSLQLSVENELTPNLNIQLFASEYDTTTNLEAYGRSKRQIKQVIRFEPCHYSYNMGQKRLLLSGLQGTGFNCPNCYAHLSYDAKQCYECNSQCKYSPGIGPMLCRDRNSFSQVASIDESKIEAWDKASCSNEKKRESRLTTAEESQQSHGNLPKIAPLDVAECEVCLKLFPMTYLDGHRLKSHYLPTSEYGCPYCTTTFNTRNQRLEHIQHKHAGQASSVDSDLHNLTRCYLYICCECQVPLHYTALKYHLQHEHNNMDIFQCLDRIKTICPFCNGKHFHLIDDLLLHVKNVHPRACIIGKRLRIGSTNKLQKNSTLRGVCYSNESTASPIHLSSFQQLSMTKLIHGFNLALNTRKRFSTPDVVKTTIDKLLLQAQQRIPSKATKEGLHITIPGEDKDEEEYTSERKLFLKGVRDRSQKAEREELEKMKFKENWEQTQRKLVYECRSTNKKKKSSYDTELEELIIRPIVFGSDTAVTVSSGTYHKCDLCTSIIFPCDDILKSNNRLTPGYNSTSIDSSGFSNFHDLKQTSISIANAFDGDKEHRNRGHGDKFRLKSDMLKLLEVKNALSFIEMYNKGLITDKRKV